MEYTMIPKAQMEDCTWYKGYCRNAWFAMWDEKLGQFRHYRFKFGWWPETIQHFEDAGKGQDGFIPVEKIERPDYKEINNLKHKIGY